MSSRTARPRTSCPGGQLVRGDSWSSDNVTDHHHQVKKVGKGMPPPVPLDSAVREPVVRQELVCSIHPSHVLIVLDNGFGLLDYLMTSVGQPGAPLHNHYLVTVDGGKYSDQPLLCPLHCYHGVSHINGPSLSLPHSCFHTLWKSPPVHLKGATCSKPIVLEVSEESWRSVKVVCVDMMATVLQGESSLPKCEMYVHVHILHILHVHMCM